jgi:hypothetical protein
MKLELSPQIFEKISNFIKILRTEAELSRVVPHGQTDGHDKSKSRFSQFCEHAQKSN